MKLQQKYRRKGNNGCKTTHEMTGQTEHDLQTGFLPQRQCLLSNVNSYIKFKLNI
jgi:hypothetical protein